MNSFLSVIIFVIAIASLWKIFEKAGVEGWKALIPFYNMWVLAEIAGLPGWVGLAAIFSLLIPILGIFIFFGLMLYIYYGLAKAFGKDILYALGLTFLSFIFLPILAFGDATYTKPEPKDPLKKIEK